MKRHFFLFSVIIIQTFFLLVQLKNHNLYLRDSAEYLTEASNITNRGIFYCASLDENINPSQYTRRPPLYPMFIGFSHLFFASDLFIILLQNILSVLSILLMRKTAMEWGYLRKTDHWVILAFIFSPAQFIYAQLIMSEILFQFILVLAIRYFVLYLKRGRLNLLLIYNLLIFFAAFTKPVMYLFVFPNLLYFSWISLRKKTMRPLLMSLIPILLVFVYCFRNLEKTGKFSFSSIQTTNLINYNIYYFLMNQDGKATADEVIDNFYKKSGTINNYSKRMDFLSGSARKVIMEQPFEYGWFHIKGMLRFFLDPGRFDLVNFIHSSETGKNGFLYYLNTGGISGALRFLFSGGTGGLSLLLIFIFLVNLVKLAGLVLFAFNRQVDWRLKVFLYLLLLYLAFATGPLGASRFAMPLIPLLIFMAFTAGNRDVLMQFTGKSGK